MVSEVGVAKRTELSRRHLAFLGKVILLEDPLDPNVDREGPKSLVGKEHYTISNLYAYTRELAKVLA